MATVLLPLPAFPGERELISWQVDGALVHGVASPSPDQLPDSLRELIESGVVESVRLQPGRIDTRLRPGRTPQADGAAVRTALHRALSGPTGWLEQIQDHDESDAWLAEQVCDVLHGEFGAYTAGHGGQIELVDVTRGVVTVRLRGCCHGCAAAEVTLQRNLAARLAKIPGFGSLAAVD